MTLDFRYLEAVAAGDMDGAHARYLEIMASAVTPGGLPYPSPTDPVAQGADAIRALAEAVDTLRLVPTRLGAAADIKGVTDCNQALEAGWYRAPSAANSPVSASGGSLMVFRAASNAAAIRQEFRRIYYDGSGEDTRMWTRTSLDSGASWSAWKLGYQPEDTGWIVPTSFVNGFSNGSSVGYRRYNGVVFLRGEVVNGTAPTALTTAFTLPAGFRPAVRQRVVNFVLDYSSMHGVNIDPTGIVQISANFAKPTTPGYGIAASFIADN